MRQDTDRQMSFASKVSENLNCITGAYIWRNQRRRETSTSGKLVHLVCCLFMWMRLVSHCRLCSCVPPPLLSPCIVGVDHLPAHQGVFSSVSESPYRSWMMSEWKHICHDWNKLLVMKDSQHNQKFGFFSDAHFTPKFTLLLERENATSKSFSVPWM